MIHVFKMFRFLLAATMLAAFASPAVSAPPVDKKFFASITDPTASGAFVTFTITNATPDANSVLNSFIIIPPPNVTIVREYPPTWSVTEPVGAGATFTAIPTTGQITQLKVNGISGLQPTEKTGVHTMKVQFKITYDGSSSCGAVWNAQAFAGNAWSQPFLLQPDDPNTPQVDTDLTMAFPDAQCSLAFTVQPTNTLSGAIIAGPVTVKALPTSLFSGKTITLGFDSVQGGSPSIKTGLNSKTATVNEFGFASFPELVVTGPGGPYKLSATAAAVLGSPTAASAPFFILPNDGILWCKDAVGPPPNIVVEYFDAAANTTLRRFDNKDGSACIAIPFLVVATNSGKTVEIKWDEIQQPNITLETETTWPYESVGTNGLVASPTQYDVGGGPKTVPACLSQDLPAQIGTLLNNPITLASTYNATETTIAINFPGGTPTKYPFPIVVPSNQLNTDPERMLVVASAGGSSYTVVRASWVGPMSATTHTAGAKVMSTPAPIAQSAENGAVGQPVPVCMLEETVTTVTFDHVDSAKPAETCPTPLANMEPTACVRVHSRLRVLGDVLILRD